MSIKPQSKLGKSFIIQRTEEKRFHFISSLKLQEQTRLNVLEAQKNTLIREIHHRIKNHLQGVTGLLSQKAHANPAIADILNETIGQVQTIAKVHGLQGSHPEGHLELSDILSSIVQSVDTVSLCTFVQSEIGQCTATLNDEESVPIALILNELLLNASKHSDYKRDKNNNTVSVKLRYNNNDAVITIINHSQTPPTSFNLETGQELGVGLSLVNALMPTKGAKLEFTHQDTMIKTQLFLTQPVVNTCKI